MDFIDCIVQLGLQKYYAVQVVSKKEAVPFTNQGVLHELFVS